MGTPLSTLFLEAWASREDRAPELAEATPSDQARSELESCLERLHAEGRSAWPVATVSKEQFVRCLAERSPGPTPADLTRMHTADLYLACACAAGDARAVARFDSEYLLPLPLQLLRTGVDLALAQDALQTLRERLFVGASGARAKIADYDARGALAGWVRVAALRLASNLRRDEAGRATRDATEGVEPDNLAVLDPTLALIQRRYRDAFQSALRDAFGSLSEEERNTLRLYFSDGLNLDAIGRVLGISRATVGRRMVSARARVRTEVLRLFADRVRATPTEVESLLAIIESKLDVSFSALAQSQG